jgi:uncharacterized Zn finger protein
MSEVRIICPTCKNEPTLFIEMHNGEPLLSAKCDECGNYFTDDDISDFLKFWEVDE